MTSFEAMSKRVYDSIFQHTCDYLSDMLGHDQWGALPQEIMYSVVEKIWKEMNTK
jgi:hypothetical protein